MPQTLLQSHKSAYPAIAILKRMDILKLSVQLYDIFYCSVLLFSIKKTEKRTMLFT